MSTLILWFLLVAGATTEPTDSRTHYVSPDYCKYEFDYPSNWAAELLPRNEHTSCAVRLRPKKFRELMTNYDVDVYSLVVSTPGGGTFLDAASEGGFDFYKNEWITRGRQGARGSAELLTVGEFSGLRGTATVGCDHEAGGYAGLCEFERVVLQDTHDNIWMMEGGPQTTEAFAVVLASFKIKRRQDQPWKSPLTPAPTPPN